MTYRVSEGGATVFDAEGKVVIILAPGTVVVEGRTDAGGSLAQQYEKLHGKRRTGYEDKRRHVDEDKRRHVDEDTRR